jgi:hypothetical protein
MTVTVEPTPQERRALAYIWEDVEPGFGHAAFGAPEPTLSAESLFGEFLRRYLVQHRPNMRTYRPRPRTFRRDEDGTLIVSCVGAKAHEYDAHLVLDRDGSVAIFAVGRALPPGLVARVARRDEYESVAELIRDAPVVTGDRSFSIWLKRLPDALAMQGESKVLVVERPSDGRLLAVRASRPRNAVFMGQSQSVGQAYQGAVLPEARGLGLENALIPLMTRLIAPHATRFYSLIDAGNVAILQAMGGERVPR